MFKKNRIISLIISLMISSQAFALNNEDKTVTQVDVTESQVIVWVHKASGEDLGNQTACNGNEFGAVACTITSDFCKSVLAMAMTAKTTNNEVDFTLDGCNGSFSEVTRFRLSY